MPFDINKKDVTGQSALYLACYVGNQKLVDILIKYRVQANKYRVSLFHVFELFLKNFGYFYSVLSVYKVCTWTPKVFAEIIVWSAK